MQAIECVTRPERVLTPVRIDRGQPKKAVLSPKTTTDEAERMPVSLGAKAAGDDHFPVFIQRIADRLQRFLARGIEESARIDDHHIRPHIRGGEVVALRTKLRQNPLRIDERFCTTQ